MKDILCKKLHIFVIIYLYDILVFSKDANAYKEHLHWDFNQLQKHHLKIKKSKYKFGVSSVQYLGHIISKDGILVDPKKTIAIDKSPVPTYVRDLQVFLGMCNYYAKFLKSFAHQATPLYASFRKDTSW